MCDLRTMFINCRSCATFEPCLIKSHELEVVRTNNYLIALFYLYWISPFDHYSICQFRHNLKLFLPPLNLINAAVLSQKSHQANHFSTGDKPGRLEIMLKIIILCHITGKFGNGLPTLSEVIRFMNHDSACHYRHSGNFYLYSKSQKKNIILFNLNRHVRSPCMEQNPVNSAKMLKPTLHRPQKLVHFSQVQF